MPKVDFVLEPCTVCGVDVVMAAGSDEDALCVEHFFSADPTEDWETDDAGN